jgi:hypothetical protein
MKEYIKVSGHDGLFRDPKTNSIINTNKPGYNEYLNMRDIKSKENQKVHSIEEEVANIKNDVNEIKSLLKELINGSR